MKCQVDTASAFKCETRLGLTERGFELIAVPKCVSGCKSALSTKKSGRVLCL